MTNERPADATGNVMYELGRNLRVNVWVTGDVETDAMRLGDTYAAIREWLAHDEKARTAIFPPEPERPQTPQNRPQGRPAPRGGGGQRRGGGGKGQSRADRFEVYAGEFCDECDGPVGVYPMTGNMRSPKLVCLGRCKDGEYVHTVRWLDEDEPDSMPF